MKLIVGLGNPGSQYTSTRHNVGYRCIDILAIDMAIPLKERRRWAILGKGTWHGTELVLAKPRTFMNESGQALKYLRDRFGFDPQDLLVIYDDMDLPLGVIRIRPEGSSGGHRGVQSIIESLGTQDFPRLRIGIDRPQSRGAEIGHVLNTFSREEAALLEEALSLAREAVGTILLDGLDKAMSHYN